MKTATTLTARAFALLCTFGLSGPSSAADKFECLIEPTQFVEIRSSVVGTLDQVLVKRGDRVSKGQLIVTLESSAERASANLAKYKSEMLGPTKAAAAKLEYSQKKAQRRRQMQQENLMSGQDADDAEGEMKTAEAELTVAQENKDVAKLEWQEQNALLGRRTIVSPFDGVVADQLVYPGEVVDPNDPKKPILKLAQLDPLRVHVVLPRAAFGKVHKGMISEVMPEAPVGRPLKGTVIMVDRLVDAGSGTFGVFVEVPNKKMDVPAGLRCTASFP